MRNYLFYVLGLVLLASCSTDDSDAEGSFMFLFYPRNCQNVRVDNACFSILNQGEEKEGYVLDALHESSVKASNFLIVIQTNNTTVILNQEYTNSNQYNPIEQSPYKQFWYLDDPLTDAHDQQLERQLEESYNRTYRHLLKGDFISTPVPMDYRLDEVKQLRILSDVPLFGQNPGRLLNDYFTIVELEPACVFSSNNQMIMGFEDDTKGLTIAKWLSMRPLAAASLYLRFKSVPEETPVKAKIIVEMELANGKVLRSESDAVNLLS
ncbi:hypothetical protein DMA11_12160 [Marinilabiliaceae bacterium JC017]|nr:hypothetical protein DMA11_12160 [Marinilabiliaceae bacterium JC017]